MEKAVVSLVSIFGIFASSIFLSGCNEENVPTSENKGNYIVSFDKVLDIETNAINDQVVTYGSLLKQPNVVTLDDSGYVVSGWYEDKSYSLDSEWDFDLDKVTNDMTLYAKWSQVHTVSYYLPNNLNTPVYEAKIKEGLLAYECDEKIPGYKIEGYFLDKEFTKQVDFSKEVNEDMDIYIKTDMLLYFSSSSIASNFAAHSATGSGSSAGTISMDGENAKIDFGISYPAEGAPHGDPYISLEGVSINIEETQDVTFVIKNLGVSRQLAFYWTGFDSSGKAVGSENYSEQNVAYYTFPSSQQKMSTNDEWLNITFNLGKTSSNWSKIKQIGRFRLQSNATVRQGDADKNIFLVKEIMGTHDDRYDARNPLVSFMDGNEKLGSIHMTKGSIITKEDIDNAVIGNKIKGYYSNSSKTNEIAFPLVINDDTSIYLDIDSYLYFEGKDFTKFNLNPASGNNSIIGNLSYDESKAATKVNFGISTLSDPHIVIENAYINVSSIKKINMTILNTGHANQFGIYWAGFTKDGSEIKNLNENCAAWLPLTSSQMNMDESCEFTTITFDLSSNANWSQMTYLTTLRIQSCYVSSSSSDYSNVVYFRNLEGAN